MIKPRRKEPAPSFIPDEVIKRVGDHADTVGINLRLGGSRNLKQGREYNALAHWLWRIAGAEPSDIEPENEKKIRTGRR